MLKQCTITQLNTDQISKNHTLLFSIIILSEYGYFFFKLMPTLLINESIIQIPWFYESGKTYKEFTIKLLLYLLICYSQYKTLITVFR